jgi:Ca2+-binding RTX toxin-like protein
MAVYSGSEQADRIDGSADADTLTGNGGNDTLRGLSGADFINGGSGDDQLASDSTIVAGPNGQYVSDTGPQQDTLIGGAGNDWIFAGYGDVVDGGDGVDRLALDWRGATSGGRLEVGDLFRGQSITVGGGTIQGINGITELRGSEFADFFSASPNGVNPPALEPDTILNARTEIWSYGGNDTILGGFGVAFIDGGEGDDVLTGGDTILGGNGNDQIFGATIYVDGGAGNDTIDVRGPSTYVHGAGGNDNITSDGAATVIYGDDGDDALGARSSGTLVSDTLNGGAGNDSFSADGGGDVLIGGVGDDRYFITTLDQTIVEAAGEGYDTVIAVGGYVLAPDAEIELFSTLRTDLARDVTMTGSLSSQLIIADAGNNVLRGGGATSGAGDSFHGLEGNDTYIVDGPSATIEELVGRGNDTVILTASAGISFVLTADAEVEAITTQSNAATLGVAITGNAFAQAITGDYGNNVIDGGGTSLSGGGADTLIGLRGDDSYVVRSSQTQIGEAAGEGNDTVLVTAAALNYQLTSGAAVETLSAEVGTAAINIAGNGYAQVLNGNDGNNILSTGGGGAADTLNGGLGDDIYRVFSTGDVINDTGGSDTVYASGTSYFLYSTASIEYLSTAQQAGTESFYLVGNGVSQVIAGNYGDNILNGRGGDDAGLPDTLIGLYGNDAYAVFTQGDVVREQAGQGVDTVYAHANYQLRDGTEVEGLAAVDASSTTDAYTLRGNEFAQTIVGNQAGNVLDGRGGSDTLIGLGGADTFAFTTAVGTVNVDTIQDFAAGDKIGLASDVFGSVTSGGIQAGEFVIGTAAADADDRLIYDQATGKLWYDADGSGAGAAVQFAQLTPGTVLNAGDFVEVAPVANLAAA